MNHHQDIDDGLEEHQDTLIEQADEAYYLAHPEAFNTRLDYPDEDPLFCPTRVLSLTLIGPKDSRKHGPEAYRGFRVVLEGLLSQRRLVRVSIDRFEHTRDTDIADA